MPLVDQYAPAPFPAQGLDLTRGFGLQAPGTTRTGLNVRTWEPAHQRARGGQRPGLARHSAGQLPTAAAVQCLDYVVSTLSAALAGDCCNLWTQPGPQHNLAGIDTIYLPFLNTITTANDPRTLQLVTDPNTGRQIPFGGTGDQPVKTNAGVPLISWATPAPVAAGTALSGTQLNAVATDPATGLSVPGTYTYYPPAGTVLSQGLGQLLGVVFTPTNGTKFCCIATKVSIDVNPPSGGGGGSPFVVAPAPAAAGWGVVAPTLLIGGGGSGFASAAWAVAAPTPEIDMPPTSPSAGWAVVAPTISITGGGPARVGTGAKAANTTTTLTLTYTPSANGNCLIAVIYASRSTGPPTITLPSGFSISGSVNQTDSTDNVGTLQIAFNPNCSTATTSYVFSRQSGTGGGIAAIMYEYSGLNISTPVDKSISAAALSNGTAAASGATATTTAAHEAWIGACAIDNASNWSSPTNSFTLVDQTSETNGAICFLERIVSSTGTANAGATASVSGAWIAGVTTFKA